MLSVPHLPGNKGASVCRFHPIVGGGCIEGESPWTNIDMIVYLIWWDNSSSATKRVALAAHCVIRSYLSVN